MFQLASDFPVPLQTKSSRVRVRSNRSMPSWWVRGGSKAIVSDFNPRGTTSSKTQQVQIAGFHAKKALPLETSQRYCEKQNHPISSIVFKFRLTSDPHPRVPTTNSGEVCDAVRAGFHEHRRSHSSKNRPSIFLSLIPRWWPLHSERPDLCDDAQWAFVGIKNCYSHICFFTDPTTQGFKGFIARRAHVTL